MGNSIGMCCNSTRDNPNEQEKNEYTRIGICMNKYPETPRAYADNIFGRDEIKNSKNLSNDDLLLYSGHKKNLKRGNQLKQLSGSLQVKINEAIIDRDKIEQKMRDIFDQTQRFDKNFNLYLKLHSKEQHFKS